MSNSTQSLNIFLSYIWIKTQCIQSSSDAFLLRLYQNYNYYYILCGYSPSLLQETLRYCKALGISLIATEHLQNAYCPKNYCGKGGSLPMPMSYCTINK